MSKILIGNGSRNGNRALEICIIRGFYRHGRRRGIDHDGHGLFLDHRWIRRKNRRQYCRIDAVRYNWLTRDITAPIPLIDILARRYRLRRIRLFDRRSVADLDGDVARVFEFVLYLRPFPFTVVIR